MFSLGRKHGCKFRLGGIAMRNYLLSISFWITDLKELMALLSTSFERKEEKSFSLFGFSIFFLIFAKGLRLIRGEVGMRVSEVSRNPWVWRKDPRRFRFSCRCCFTTTTHHCCNQTLSCVDILSWKINTKILQIMFRKSDNLCIRKNTWISYNTLIFLCSTTRNRHLSWVLLFPEKYLQNSWNGYVTHLCTHSMYVCTILK